MSGKTTIEWTAMPGYAPAVWNPTTGCTRVSAGCDNCYAFALHDKRYKANLDAAERDIEHAILIAPGAHVTKSTKPEVARRNGIPLPWPKQYDLPFSHVQLLEERLDAPLRKRKPTCYFVDSMADLFHEDVPDDFIDAVFLTMERAPQHRFLILTKRPERMWRWATFTAQAREAFDNTNPYPHANVWLGTSVEDQASADERIPHLLATPAAVRFLSCEPLLGELDLNAYLPPCEDETHAHIDWVIAGGESGPRARPMDLAWARSLRDQCAAAGVSFFMKQMGSNPIRELLELGTEKPTGRMHKIRLSESHGRDMDEWSADLRVRTWPR